MPSNVLLRRPNLSGLAMALISLAAGTAALLGADFGRPLWWFAPLFLWLLSLGLPSTLAVLGVAWCWGSVPPLYGLYPFLMVASLAASGAQIAALRTYRHVACHIGTRIGTRTGREA